MKAKVSILVLAFVLLCVTSGQAQANSCQVLDYDRYWWYACVIEGMEWPDYVPDHASVRQIYCDSDSQCVMMYTWSVLKNPVYLPII